MPGYHQVRAEGSFLTEEEALKAKHERHERERKEREEKDAANRKGLEQSDIEKLDRQAAIAEARRHDPGAFGPSGTNARNESGDHSSQGVAGRKGIGDNEGDPRLNQGVQSLTEEERVAAGDAIQKANETVRADKAISNEPNANARGGFQSQTTEQKAESREQAREYFGVNEAKHNEPARQAGSIDEQTKPDNKPGDEMPEAERLAREEQAKRFEADMQARRDQRNEALSAQLKQSQQEQTKSSS